MSASNHPKADFSRTCSTCKHSAWDGISPRCTVGRNLVTGRPIVMDAAGARATTGHCGPAGKRWEMTDEPITINAQLPRTGRLPHTKRNGGTLAGMIALAVLAAWSPKSVAAHHTDMCRAFVTVVGDQYASIDGAKGEADKAWQQTTRWQFGERFMDRNNARNVSYECGRSSVGSIVGQVFYRCSIKARPCRPSRKTSN